jgi:hypothetical protein
VEPHQRSWLSPAPCWFFGLAPRSRATRGTRLPNRATARRPRSPRQLHQIFPMSQRGTKGIRYDEFSVILKYRDIMMVTSSRNRHVTRRRRLPGKDVKLERTPSPQPQTIVFELSECAESWTKAANRTPPKGPYAVVHFPTAL